MREAYRDGLLEIVPLGGAAEVGKSMIVVRYGDDIVVIDAGVMFPTDEHPGVDLIIPDISYLIENAAHVRAIVLTHAHEDHIGALPHVLKQLNVPVYGTPLTLGIVREKLDEHGLLRDVRLHTYVPGERVAFGRIEVEPIRVTHSIPDTVSLAFHTPVGVMVHTGDFKIDLTPVDGRHFDAARFAALGDEGVILLLSDSVNAERKGWVPSERVVGQVLDREFTNAPGRVIVTTFASNLHRVQQFFDAAEKHGRKVCVAGRSMERNIQVAREIGFLHYHDPIRINIGDLDDYDPNEIAIITTGSQGEPLAALSRIARDDHRIRIMPGDTVILSSKPIPGNEDCVWRTVNRLFRRGARVIYDMITPCHVSGHANQEELKLMLRLTRPLYAVPFHGEPRMMYAYTEMAQEMGFDRDQIIWLENGDRLIHDGATAERAEPIDSSGSVLVDGISENGVADFVIRDRKHLANDGTVIVTLAVDRATEEILNGPDLISRGFLHPEDSETLFTEASEKVVAALDHVGADPEADFDDVRTVVRDTVARFLKKRTGRRPVVVPVVMEI